jgi:hypothetical protein
VSQALREILMVLAVAVGGVLLAGALVLTPWHPISIDGVTIIAVHPPVR